MQVTVKKEDLVLHFLEEVWSNATKLSSYSDTKLSKLGREIALVTFLFQVCMGSGKLKMIADAKFQDKLDQLCFSKITQLIDLFYLIWLMLNPCTTTSRTHFC